MSVSLVLKDTLPRAVNRMHTQYERTKGLLTSPFRSQALFVLYQMWLDRMHRASSRGGQCELHVDYLDPSHRRVLRSVYKSSQTVWNPKHNEANVARCWIRQMGHEWTLCKLELFFTLPLTWAVMLLEHLDEEGASLVAEYAYMWNENEKPGSSPIAMASRVVEIDSSSDDENGTQIPSTYPPPPVAGEQDQQSLVLYDFL